MNSLWEKKSGYKHTDSQAGLQKPFKEFNFHSFCWEAIAVS